MEIIKKTITREEITGYKAFDGTWFRHEAGCIKYEESALCAAKAAAWHYLVGDRISYDIFDSDEQGLLVFDIPDANAYEVIRHWAELAQVWDLKNFTPEYIGERTAFFDSYGDLSFNPYFATKKDMMALYAKEIDALFADKETPETK